MSKLLGDFLMEHQEPFALDIYLVERGYSKRTTSRARFHKGWRLRMKRDALPNCTGFAKALFTTRILHKYVKSTKVDQTSEEKVDTDRKMKWRLMMQDSNDKQLSPVSVLQEIESSSPLQHKNYNYNNTTQGECSFSGCKSNQAITHINNVRELGNPYDQYIINKRALRQCKQLLIDCVRELIDDKSGQQLKKILGTEELWKHVCENVWLWSQDSIHDTSITHLLNHDFVASQEEWTSHALLHKQEISREIGDAILQSILADIF